MLVKSNTNKEPRLKNAFESFLWGGLVGFLGEVFINLLDCCFGIEANAAYIYLCLVLIFIASLLTAIGVFDNVVMKAKCGLIIPTTGFAHSITSSAIDYKKDGLITGIGSNFFKLAGSVIIYSIISVFFLVFLRVFING